MGNQIKPRGSNDSGPDADPSLVVLTQPTVGERISDRRTVRLVSFPRMVLVCLTLMASAMVVAVSSNLPLLWDGSYLFYKVLDTQEPFTANHRYSDVPLHLLVLQASRLTDNLAVLRFVFGTVHAAIPILALAASWFVVRRRAPELFVWAALGVGLATLPGQMNFSSEGIKATQLFWPLLLSLLVGSCLRWTILLVPVLYFLHPLASVLFVIAAGVAVIVGLDRRGDRRAIVFLAPPLLLLAGLKWYGRSDYEMSQSSLELQMTYFGTAVAGFPLAALACGWFAGPMVLVRRYAVQEGRGRLQIITAIGGAGSVLLAGALLTWWAWHPILWKNAIGYSSWTLLCSLPFMAFAIVDTFMRHRDRVGERTTGYDDRRWVIGSAALVFFAVIMLLSVDSFDFEQTLRASLADSPSACVASKSLQALDATALNHWSISTYAAVLQSREPRQIVLTGNGCAMASRSGVILIVPWDDTSDGRGWFDLSQVRAVLTGL